MRNFNYRFFTAIILAVLVSLSAYATEKPDSKGKEYWLMFTQNYEGLPTLTLYISGEEATTGIVEIPGQSWSTVFSVIPGEITSVLLPPTSYASGNDGVENKGIHIVAEKEVTVYGLNKISYTTDAFLGLPVDILGREYITLGYRQGYLPETIGIVSTADETVVTITPKTTTGSRAAGVPYDITLNRGETYQLHGEDLSGSSIISSQPVAVFGGTRCAFIPSGIGGCDYVVEQLVPTRAWGKNFLTVPLKERIGGDTFRVLASENNTKITINDIELVTLNRGQFHELILTSSSNIRADKPVLVAQYANGEYYDNVANTDPFMMLVPPHEQYEGKYTITTPATDFNRNYVNVIASTAFADGVKLDGVLINSSNFAPIGSSGFSGAQLTITPGSHTLESSQPIGVFVYGYGVHVSYGYPGGMSLASIVYVDAITLTPKTAETPYGGQHCIEAKVLDQHGVPLEGIRVDFTVSGANSTTGFATTNSSGVAKFCYSPTNGGTDNIVAKSGIFSDNAVNEVEPCTAPTLTVPTMAPVAYDADLEGALVEFEATATGKPAPEIEYTILVDGNETVITSPYVFPLGTTTVTATATSNCGTDAKTFNVVVTDNCVPNVSFDTSTMGPALINSSVSVNASYLGNSLRNATWNWGDGSATESANIEETANGAAITGNHVYSGTGVFRIVLTIEDDCASSATQSGEFVQYIVVYDPNGGFVTGGGWIDSPAGAYRVESALAGRANFGFVSKYQKGTSVPTGNTNFQFQVANLHFQSTSYEWLVISGASARYKGEGTINGSGRFGFLLSATDGQVTGGGGIDKFRMQIWDKDDNDRLVYDNNGDAAIAGGSIVIHDGKATVSASSSKKAVIEPAGASFYTYPTAFSDKTTIAFSLEIAEAYSIEVYDVRGTLVKRIAAGAAEANKLYEFELNAKGMSEGIYITRLITGSKVQSIKAVLRR